MTTLSVALSMLLVAHAGAHEGHFPHHHPHPTPRSIASMDSVLAACSRDVVSLCPMPSDFLFDFQKGDFMNPPPFIIDSSFMDHMITSALRLSSDQPMGTVWTIVYDVGGQEEPKELQMANNLVSLPGTPATPENVLDSMVSSLVDHNAADPSDFVKRLQDHGSTLLQDTSISEERRRLARRLLEASPNVAVAGPLLPLPFGCPKNRCLMEAYRQDATSDICSYALRNAENVRDSELVRQALEHQTGSSPSNGIYYGFFACFILLACCGLIRMHPKALMGGRKHIQLKKSILQAVYSDPKIKAAVEAKLQEGIGNVPHLPRHELVIMGGTTLQPSKFRLKLLISACLVPFIYSTFFNATSVELCALLWCVVLLYWYGNHSERQVRKCTCCCCGLSTEDVANGIVTDTQACCTCCNGLGVCGPLCISCCGTDPENGCDCCSEECDCCNPKLESLSAPTNSSKIVVYQGVPVQIV